MLISRRVINEPAHKICVLITNSRAHCSNKHAQLHSGTTSLSFSLGLYPYAYCVCVRAAKVLAFTQACRASDFFKIGGPEWPMEQKPVGHFLK